MARRGLRLGPGFFLVSANRGYSVVVVRGLIAVASLES